MTPAHHLVEGSSKPSSQATGPQTGAQATLETALHSPQGTLGQGVWFPQWARPSTGGLTPQGRTHPLGHRCPVHVLTLRHLQTACSWSDHTAGPCSRPGHQAGEHRATQSHLLDALLTPTQPPWEGQLLPFVSKLMLHLEDTEAAGGTWPGIRASRCEPHAWREIQEEMGKNCRLLLHGKRRLLARPSDRQLQTPFLFLVFRAFRKGGREESPTLRSQP